MKLIVATDLHGVIGTHNKIPWHVPEDLKYFKELTSGQTVIMGRKTSDSLRPFFPCGRLPNRRNIIISSSAESNSSILRDGESQTWTCDLESIYAGKANLDPEKTWIIGGSSIYNYFLPVVTHIYLTEIHTSVDHEDADAFFMFDKSEWRLLQTTPILASVSKHCDGSRYKYTHQVFVRK